MKVPDLYVGKRLFVGEGAPIALGRGPTEVRGSSYIEGPLISGDPTEFPVISAGTMIGPVVNIESPIPVIPGAICGFNHSPYSLSVIGDACIFDNLTINKQVEVGTHLLSQGEVISRFGGGYHILSNKKNFDIEHPNKEGWRLRHVCIEGPTADVYIKGNLSNSNVIVLPKYWNNLVDFSTIVVTLTPIGEYQNLFVEKIEGSNVHIKNNLSDIINCYYHVIADRVDVEKNVVEYEGTYEDYPGTNEIHKITIPNK
jgi:NDP-sugar pyrophosphorylase family protein